MVITYLEYVQLAFVICITYIIPVLIQQRFTHFNRFSLVLLEVTLVWVIFTLSRLLRVPMFFTVAVFVVAFETLFLRLFGGINAPSLQGFFEIRAFILGTFGMILYHYIEVVKCRERPRNPAVFPSKSCFACLERI